jgi:hypothetical protein
MINRILNLFGRKKSTQKTAPPTPSQPPIIPSIPDVYSNLVGQLGTVICFHGAGGSGEAWGKKDKGKFTESLAKAGLSFICPPSISDKWNTTNSIGNPDIVAVLSIIKQLKAKGPFFLVGHSNGGAFVSRFALYSGMTFSGVQYSNAKGVQEILASAFYKVKTLFCYSVKDPIVSYQGVLYSINILKGKMVPYQSVELSKEYAQGDYRDEHEFLDTSKVSIPFFLG